MTEIKKTVKVAAKKIIHVGMAASITAASIASAPVMGLPQIDDRVDFPVIDKYEPFSLEVLHPPEHYYEPEPHIHTSGTVVTATHVYGAPTTYELLRAARLLKY